MRSVNFNPLLSIMDPATCLTIMTTTSLALVVFKNWAEHSSLGLPQVVPIPTPSSPGEDCLASPRGKTTPVTKSPINTSDKILRAQKSMPMSKDLAVSVLSEAGILSSVTNSCGCLGGTLEGCYEGVNQERVSR